MVVPIPPRGHMIVALVVRTCGIAFVLSRCLHHAVAHLENPSTARERDRAFGVVERDRLPGAGLEDDFFPLTIFEPQGVSAGRLDHPIFQVSLRRRVHPVPEKTDDVWRIDTA